MTNLLDEKDGRDYCPVCKERAWLGPGPGASRFKFELHGPGPNSEYPCPGSFIPR